MWIATWTLPPPLAALAGEMLEEEADLLELLPQDDGAETRLVLWSSVRPDPAALRALLAPVFDELGARLPEPEIGPAPEPTGEMTIARLRIGPFLLAAGEPGAGRLCFADPFAFGLGDHPTTRLCLALLPRLVKRGRQRIFDLGTGTGILALAAMRLRRRPLLASDIADSAVQAARANAGANHLAPWLRVRRANGLPRSTRRACDLLLANLLPVPLVALAPQIVAALAPGGRVLLSGLTGRQERRILARYRRLRLLCRVVEGGWRALVLEKPVAGRRRSL